jgi:hypothetical protein
MGNVFYLLIKLVAQSFQKAKTMDIKLTIMMIKIIMKETNCLQARHGIYPALRGQANKNP